MDLVQYLGWPRELGEGRITGWSHLAACVAGRYPRRLFGTAMAHPETRKKCMRREHERHHHVIVSIWTRLSTLYTSPKHQPDPAWPPASTTAGLASRAAGTAVTGASAGSGGRKGSDGPSVGTVEKGAFVAGR